MPLVPLQPCHGFRVEPPPPPRPCGAAFPTSPGPGGTACAQSKCRALYVLPAPPTHLSLHNPQGQGQGAQLCLTGPTACGQASKFISTTGWPHGKYRLGEASAVVQGCLQAQVVGMGQKHAQNPFKHLQCRVLGPSTSPLPVFSPLSSHPWLGWDRPRAELGEGLVSPALLQLQTPEMD